MNPHDKPKRIGLTGNIGSGKSTVARLLEAKGAALIDADALAREATQDPRVLDDIAATLGQDLVVGGKLDRAATAALVFDEPGARERLNAAVHPWVRRKSAERVQELESRPVPPPVILLDIPLLYENGLEAGLDAVIVVAAGLKTRVARVMARSGLSENEIRARDAAQMPLEDKVKRADYVLYNEGSLGELEIQSDRLWQELQRRGGGP
jgi:dephospho-CoA kinase